jgi:alpha-methylacyl-CoA racemase
MNTLEGYRVLTLAVNLPGPLAAARLRGFGAAVTKVEPPTGDALARVCPTWYETIHRGQTIFTLDLKTDTGRERLEALLAASDLLLTATRPAGLSRLGLDWASLHARHPRMCQVAIVGHPPPDEDVPGHDLTYQARAGLVEPPRLPRTCLADLAGAERAVSAALALLLGRERGHGAEYASVSLAVAAEEFAAPWRYSLTSPGGILGGGSPSYNLYPTREGWIAVAALEPHFGARLAAELGLAVVDGASLRQAFAARTAAEWEGWAVARDLPLVRVHEERKRCQGPFHDSFTN